MLSLLYKVFSAMLVVSVVFFSNNFQNKLFWNVCQTSVQGAFRASCILYGFFFGDIVQTRLYCSINNTFSIPHNIKQQTLKSQNTIILY